MNAILSFAPLLLRIRGALIVSLALSLVTVMAGVGLLGLSGWFLTAAAITTAGAAFNLFAPSAGVRALSFVRILARYGEKLTGHNATLRLLSDLRHWLFERLFPIAPLGRRFGRADLVSRLLADVDALDTLFLLSLGPATTALITGIVLSAGLAVVLPAAAAWYGAIYALASIAVPVALVIVSRRAGAEVLAASAELRARTLDSLDGHQDLVVFGALGRARADAAVAARRLARARRRIGAFGAVAGGAIQLLAAAATLATLIAGLAAHAAGEIDGPLLAAALLALVASFEACAMLVRGATRLAGAAAAAERLRAVADAPPLVAVTGTVALEASQTTIAFENVRFGYDPARPVIDGLSFILRPGECIALKGPSGSGKSTIAQLMVRLADPQSGAIRVNGTDIRDLLPTALRSRVALMTQDAPVFLDTIRENLRIGDPEAGDARLWNALAQVGLAAFVAGLPQLLDTLVGEAGRTLSAGQARRLCLARSLLSRADVLVLDEPTTGLDPEAEAAFLSDLRQIAAGRSVVVITHAPIPPDGFDRVLMLRDGRLATE